MTRIWIHQKGKWPIFIDTFLTKKECQDAIDNINRIMEGKPQKLTFEVEE